MSFRVEISKKVTLRKHFIKWFSLQYSFGSLLNWKEIAYLIEFLLSDRSRCITGASIPVSAGMNFC